jgi:hypothetical protein
MRVLIAGLLGGLVLFLWGMLAHVVLPLGSVGMEIPSNEDPVLEAMQEQLPRRGLYVLPHLAAEDWSDAESHEAWQRKARQVPYALVIFHPQGGSQLDFGRKLWIQGGSVLVAATLAAWLLALSNWNFGLRVIVATSLGALGWLNISMPYWNWYHFPVDFTLAALIGQVGGWLLAGLVISWWLGRSGQRT